MAEPPARPPKRFPAISMTSAGGPMAPPPRQKWDDVAELDYFHSDLDHMEKVKQILAPHVHTNGHFIVRTSITQEKTLTVSVTHDHTIRHFKINRKVHQFYLQDRLFNSINELVNFYMVNDVPNREKIPGVRLAHPIKHEIRSRNTSRSSSTRSESMDGDTRVQSHLGSQTSFNSDEHLNTYRKLFPAGQNESIMPPGSARKDRPPATLPGSNGIYNGVYYSCIRNHEENKLNDLLGQLDMSPDTDNLCECGLDMELATLPNGWSVHVSNDDNTLGRPFYVGPTGVTQWNLPEEIYFDINRVKQKFLKFLSDNYKAGQPPPDISAQQSFLVKHNRVVTDTLLKGERSSMDHYNPGSNNKDPSIADGIRRYSDAPGTSV